MVSRNDTRSFAYLGIRPRESPCYRHAASQPRPTKDSNPRFRARRYHPRASAVLVVSHHLDGLSHPTVLGLLRPSTEQDSLCFGHTRPGSEDPGHRMSFPTAPFTPFEEFPSLAAVPHHCGRCLLDVRQVNAPFTDFTASVAIVHPGSVCASGPKTHPHSEWLLARFVTEARANHRPTTVWTSRRYRLDIFPIAPLLTDRFHPPARFFADKSWNSTTARPEDRATDTFHPRPSWRPGHEIPDEGVVEELPVHSCQPGCPG